ncbi:recombination protein NinG, partial [Escherichia coli]
MAKPARRRCKNDECREWFHPAFANQWWCSPECGTKIALERRSKEREKAEKAEKAAEKKRRREEQKQK